MGQPSILSGKVDFLFRFAVLGAAHILAGMAGFAVMVIVSRWYGVEAVGLVVLATSLNAYAMIVATLGVETQAVVEVASGRADPRQLVSDVLVVRLLASLATHASLIAIALLLPPARGHLGFFIIYGCVLYLYALRVSWVYQAWGQTHTVAAVEMAIQFATLAFTLALAYFWPNLIGVALARLAAELVVSGVLLYILVQRLDGLPWPSGATALVAMVRESIHLSGIQLVRGLAFASDAIILGALAPTITTSQLGQYGAAFRVFTAAAITINAYFILLLPRVAAEISHSWRAACNSAFAAAAFFAVMALLGVVPVAMFSDQIALALFGDKFTETGPILRVLIISFPFVALRQHLRAPLVAAKRRAVDFWLALAGTTLHVSLKVLAAIFIGYQSLAWVWLIVEGSSVVVLAAFLAVTQDQDVEKVPASESTPQGTPEADLEAALLDAPLNE